MATAQKIVSWLYKFTADSLSGEHIEFVYQVSNVGDLPGIIKDLIRLTKEKKWWNVHLVEGHSRMLMIKAIKEPEETQEELTIKADQLRKRVTLQ